jgi:hypothetical protein
MLTKKYITYNLDFLFLYLEWGRLCALTGFTKKRDQLLIAGYFSYAKCTLRNLRCVY